MLLVQYGYIFLVLIFLLLFSSPEGLATIPVNSLVPKLLKARKIRKQKYQNSENISHIILCPVR